MVIDKYAKAFFDVTYEKGIAGECAAQISEISKAFTADIVMFFKNPFNSTENKLSVAKSAIEGKCSVETFNFICIKLNYVRHIFPYLIMCPILPRSSILIMQQEFFPIHVQ